MIIGVPKEIKPHEYRVGLVPPGVRTLVEAGAKVVIETKAGEGSGITDQEFEKMGADILPSAEEVWKKADLIIKVKEPIAQEFSRIAPGQAIYTYIHLAVAPELGDVLIEKKVTAIAYETIQAKDGSLPLLKPMSEVAGRMAVQAGAFYLQKDHGGKGILLGGVPGIRRGKVTILGGGVVGKNACKIALGLGADVCVIDVNVDRLEYLEDVFAGRITTRKSHVQNIEDAVAESDLVVGGVLIPGAKAPRLVTREMISQMSPGSVVVDVAVDQGGCVETCKPTTHLEPTYTVDGVIHYCVANIPGAVARSSTFALTNATLSFAKRMVEQGVEKAIRNEPELASGVNTYRGTVTHFAVAEALNKPYRSLASHFEEDK